MAKYKLRSGRHVTEDKTYKKGEIVEDDRDLVKLFPEKFELVGGSSPEAAEEEAEAAPAPRKPASPAPRTAPRRPAFKDEDED